MSHSYATPAPESATLPRYNTLAFVSFALAFTGTCAPIAIILGTLAQRQIERTNERGGALATAGIIIGAIYMIPMAGFLGIMFVSLLSK